MYFSIRDDYFGSFAFWTKRVVLLHGMTKKLCADGWSHCNSRRAALRVSQVVRQTVARPSCHFGMLPIKLLLLQEKQ